MCLEGTTPQDLPQSAPSHCIREIRATDPVAIFLRALSSCQFVQFVGKKKINSRHFRCARKRQFQVVPVVVIKQPLIALVPIRATDPVAIYPFKRFVSIRAIRGHKLTSSQFNQQIHFVPQQSSSTTPQNSPADNQNLQHSSSDHNNTWQTSC